MILFSLRTALVLLIALVVGLIAFLLAYQASPTKNVAAAALVGGSASGSALLMANAVLGASLS